MKIAPVPWCVSPTDDTCVIAADRSVVAEIDGDYNQPDTWPIMEANARLIAAAPELLEAAQVAAAVIDDFIGSQDECDEAVAVLIQLHGAIAKATGACPQEQK